MGTKHERKGIIRKKQRHSAGIFTLLFLWATCSNISVWYRQVRTKFSLRNVFTHITANEYFLWLYGGFCTGWAWERGCASSPPQQHSLLSGRGWGKHRDLEEHYCGNSWAPVSENGWGHWIRLWKKLSFFFQRAFYFEVCLVMVTII